MTTRTVWVMEVGFSAAAPPSASAIAGAAMNHLIPRSIFDWRPASGSLPAHTLRISAEDLAGLSSKGATDDSNFKRPTAVYVTVPIVTLCLGIASLYCYLQWKKSLVQKRERKLEKVAQRRRRVSMKQGAAAASTGSGVSAGASSLITPLTVASAPPTVLGLVTKVEIVDKMILEFESPQCGASMPQQHLINVDDQTFNVTINPLYNALQSGACGYVRSGAEIKNKALAIAEEIHRRSTLLINFQSTPMDNFLTKAGGSSTYRNADAENAKDRSRSLSLSKTQRESASQSKTKGQIPTSSGRGAIKSTPLRPLSRLSQVSSSSTPASPTSPTASADEKDGEPARSSSFSTSASDDELSSPSTTKDVGSMSRSSSAGDLDNPTNSKFMEGLASSSTSPRRLISAGPSGEYNPPGGSSGAGPSRTRKALSFATDSKSPEDFEPDFKVSFSPESPPPSHDPASAHQPPEPSSLTSNLHDSHRPVPKRS